MFGFLTEGIKYKIIEELRKYWVSRPRFRDTVIQGSYSFKERPQRGIVVHSTGGSSVNQSADNFRGVVSSYVYNAKVGNNPGAFLEFVREDSRAIQVNGGVFPSPPGIYYIKMVEDDQFIVDILLETRNETLTVTGTNTALAHPPVKGSLRLYEMPNRFLFYEGVNYTLELDSQNKPTGRIVLTDPLTRGRTLLADYRYAGDYRGPFKYTPEFANNQVIPGVVLGFNAENEKGDLAVVIVQPKRVPAHLEFGGRWNINMEIEVFARDVNDRAKLNDGTLGYFLGMAKSRLGTEGFDIVEINPTGEGEEIYDEAGDDYFYTATINMSVESDWTTTIPLEVILRVIDFYTREEIRIMAGLTESELVELTQNVNSLGGLGIVGNVTENTLETLYEIIH